MKKLVIFLILLVMIPSTLADWFYNSQYIVTDIDISSSAEIVPTTPSGYVESATINMTFYPKQTDTQDLLKFYTNPDAEATDKALKFTWKNPKDEIDFRVNAGVKTANAIVKVKKKIKFPIEELPEDIVIYTKPSETIDSNDDDIIRIASELVKGEDNLYAAVFKIADWTKNNINYNLSTLTAEVSQKASWVLQNKKGVCDELTSLFIALLRAVGVPARFVSGIAYTSSELFPENWGPHGWAEVYFPGYGWVPFDVTYGEFGWIDPTHVKFKDSIDSDEPSTYYQWLGRNIDLKTNKLDIKTKLLDQIGYYKIPLKIDASPLKKSINFGSYNLLEATVENVNDFYYATELHLSKPKEIKIIANKVGSSDFMSDKASTDFAVVGNERKSILLPPEEKKKVFWILKLDDNLDSRYSYTFPLVVSTLHNITLETSFTSSIRERDVSFDEIKKTAKLLEEEKEKKYSANVILDCKIEKSEFYEYEDVKVYCDAKNIGNIFLENADVCFENICSRLDLGISQAKELVFEVNKSNIGQRESTASLRNDLVSKAHYVNFKVNDIPKIEIENLIFPTNVSYDGNFSVSFTIAKKSFSNPRNIEVIMSQNGLMKKWAISELENSRDFIVNFEGNQLTFGKNDYEINVNYRDGLNKQYSSNKNFSIYLTNANPYQRVILFLNNFAGISTEAIAIMLLTGTIAFILVVLWLFRRRRRY